MYNHKLRREYVRACRLFNRGREDQLELNEALANQVRQFAEDGQVAVVTNGMDCDCVSWSGRVNLLPAIPILVRKWIEEYYQYAEGPQSHYLTSPSIAQGIRTKFRDLGLEAFENGHPHIVRH